MKGPCGSQYLNKEDGRQGRRAYTKPQKDIYPFAAYLFYKEAVYRLFFDP